MYIATSLIFEEINDESKGDIKYVYYKHISEHKRIRYYEHSVRSLSLKSNKTTKIRKWVYITNHKRKQRIKINTDRLGPMISVLHNIIQSFVWYRIMYLLFKSLFFVLYSTACNTHYTCIGYSRTWTGIYSNALSMFILY